MGTGLIRNRFYEALLYFDLEAFNIVPDLDFSLDSNDDGTADNVVNYVSDNLSVDEDGQHFVPQIAYSGVYVDIPLLTGNKYFTISESTVMTAADSYIEVGHGGKTMASYLALKNGERNSAGLMFTAYGSTGRFRLNTNSDAFPEFVWHSLKIYDLTALEAYRGQV